MKQVKIKTIFCHVAIIVICMGVFCHGYMGVSISMYDGLNVYAQDSWEDVNQDDLVTAFRYYCKSRNLTIDGSIADALTSFTTTTFNNICSSLGINVNSLQANLKKTVEGNLGLRFLMNQQGVLAYNRIFAEFLQNNDLSIGDDVNDKSIYDGKFYSDGNNKYLIYVIDKNYLNVSGSPYLNDNIQMGSTFMYDKDDLINLRTSGQTSVSLSFLGNNRDFIISLQSNLFGSKFYSMSGTNSSFYDVVSGNMNIYEANYALIYYPSSNQYGLGVFCYGNFNSSDRGLCYSIFAQGNTFTIDDTNISDTNIYVTTNNNTINNNNYTNNYTIIYNDGDYYEDDDEPGPSTPPGGGGGGGGGDDPGQDPDEWNPTTPSIPGPSSPDFPSINLPDIDIPDLPSLNFSLGDLREKFPFSLPFDIIAVLNVLDGEPKAPHIEATVPIGKWYTWEIDFDFSEFDNYARLFRAFEFIGFCIGLAVFTVHFVKG